MRKAIIFCASSIFLAACGNHPPGPGQCGDIYLDSDGDGYGDAASSVYSCETLPGYVANNKDCCDTDALAHPGQETYYSSVNSCGSYDYDCDGTESPQSNGSSDCSAALGSCVYVGTDCVSTGGLPPACNDRSVVFETASCGSYFHITYDTCIDDVANHRCYSRRDVVTAARQACR